MTVLVCIAGLGQDAVSAIKEQPARFSGEEGNVPIIRAINGDLNYRPGMSDGYLSKLASRIVALPALTDVSIVLVYVDYPGQGTREFLNAFFPFAVTMPIQPFYFHEAPKHDRRHRLREFLASLELELASLRRCAGQVKDKLSGQRFSPLTLPVRNFRSSVLTNELASLFEGLWRAKDPALAIGNAIRTITSAHPIKRIKYDEKCHPTDPDKPYFLDDRGMRFKSPGNDLHGFLDEVGNGHNSACLITSRVRIGGPIVPRMHYDCDYFPCRKVSDTFANCHDEATTAKKTSHANIAPSDAIW